MVHIVVDRVDPWTVTVIVFSEVVDEVIRNSCELLLRSDSPILGYRAEVGGERFILFLHREHCPPAPSLGPAGGPASFSTATSTSASATA